MTNEEKKTIRQKKTYNISCYSDRGTVIDIHSHNFDFITKCLQLLESYKLEHSLKTTIETTEEFIY